MTELLQLAGAGSGLSPQLLSAPGGFLWWYVDLIDENGDGLVIIWSYGLPFLPGYADAHRRGQPQTPGQRPSLNISIYRDGELDFYLLQEFDPDEVDWKAGANGDHWRFGRSRLRSVSVDGGRTVDLDLCLDVPDYDKPVRINLHARGPGSCDQTTPHDPNSRACDPLPDHDWVPLLCACPGRARVQIGETSTTLSGRLYHDRNGGRTPLHDLGIESWCWGRLAMPDFDFIYYLLDGCDGQSQAELLVVDDKGQIQRRPDLTLHRHQKRKNLGGLRWWPSMSVTRDGDAWLQIDHRHVVDSGPFYLRSIMEATDGGGQRYQGIAEVCEPDRIDRMIHRPLVKMRVHHRSNLNSMWLPLFSGPRRGRVARLLRSVLPENKRQQ